MLGLHPTSFGPVVKNYGIDFTDEDFKAASNKHSGHQVLRTIANEQSAKGLNLIIANSLQPDMEQRNRGWPQEGERARRIPDTAVYLVCLGDKFTKTIGILDQTYEWSPYMLWPKSENDNAERRNARNRQVWYDLVEETANETTDEWSNHQRDQLFLNKLWMVFDDEDTREKILTLKARRAIVHRPVRPRSGQYNRTYFHENEHRYRNGSWAPGRPER